MSFSTPIDPTKKTTAPAAPPPPVELSSTFGADRSLKTSTPGGTAPAYPGLSSDLIALMLQRRAQQPAPAAQAPPMERAAGPRREPEPPRYVPQMGTQQSAPQREETLTRTVIDPQASPWTKMQTGFDPRSVQERFIPGFGWEFQDLRPHGSSGGIQGGGNPFSKFGAADDPRMRSLVAQQKAATGGKG